MVQIETPANAVRRLMKLNALSQAGVLRLCADAGHKVGQSTLSEILSGAKPSPETAKALAKVFGVPVASFIPELAEVMPAAPGGQAKALDPGVPRDPALQLINLANITPSHLNPRRTIEEDPLRELAESIAQQGLLQNLVVRQDAEQKAIYWIVAGERRYRAFEILRRENRLPAELAANGIPCRVLTLDDGEHLALALLENLQREDVNPMEEAEAFAKLQALDPVKYATGKIAMALGKSKRHIQLRLALVHGLTDAAKEQLKDGTIKLAHARELARMPEQLQTKMLETAATTKPEQLRKEAGYHLIPIEAAKFPTAAVFHDLEMFEDPDTGKHYFTNIKAFLVYQKREAEHMAQRLHQMHRKVTILVSGWFANYQYEKGKDAVIHIHERSGELTVHLNVRDRDERKPADPMAKQREEAKTAIEREQMAAIAELMTKIRAALTVEEAVSLLLLDVLANSDVRPLNTWIDGPTRTSLVKANGPLAVLAELLPAPKDRGLASHDMAKAFDYLHGVGLQDLDEAIRSAVAHRLSGPAYGQAPTHMLTTLAKAHDIALPLILGCYGKAKKAEIERRASAQFDLEDAIAKAPRKKPAAAADDQEVAA